MSGVMKRIVTIIMVVILIMAPLSSCFAVDEIVTETVLHLIWDTLASWGIDIVGEVADELSEDVIYWLNGDIIDYVHNELNETLDSWITGMQFTADAFGRVIGNNYFVEKINAYANRLINKYNLPSVGDVVVSGGTINGVQVYGFPFRISFSPTSGFNYIEEGFEIYSSTPSVFVVYSGNSPTEIGVNLLCYSEVPFQIRVDRYNNGVLSSQNTYTGTYDEQHPGYFIDNCLSPYPTKTQYEAGQNPYTIYASGAYLANTRSELHQYLGGEVIESSISIVTDNPLLPSNDPAYHTGNSIIYYSDGTVAYLDIEWPKTISVDNLPAVISSTDTSDPGFQGAFTPIKAFVNTFSDGMMLIKDIAFRLPIQAWVCFYAIFGITVIFGALHMFKEH